MEGRIRFPIDVFRKGEVGRWLARTCVALGVIAIGSMARAQTAPQPQPPRGQTGYPGQQTLQSGSAQPAGSSLRQPAGSPVRSPVRPPYGAPAGQPAGSPVQPPSGMSGGQPGTPGMSAQPAQHAPAAPVAPFRLTPQQQAQVDQMLQLWERQSAQVKTFRCSFKRWVWDPVFGPPDRPKFEDLGTIRYAAPDKGLFQVEKTIRNGQAVAVEPERAEHWVCNGKSVFEYNHARRQVTEYPLPPELQGQAITNGPLPFLFGARADALRRRYFLRIITPPDVQGKQIWLEAWPRFQADAANFQRAHLILTTPDMTPFALNVYSPNGKNRTAYQFYDVKTNESSWWLSRDPFAGSVPLGWQKVVEQPAPVEAQRPATAPRG